MLMAVMRHKPGDCGPEQHDDHAVTMLWVHAGSAQLDQIRNITFDPWHKEFALAVVAANALCLIRRQQPIGANNLLGLGQTNNQVLTVIIEFIFINTRC